jgi:hypothetical protein
VASTLTRQASLYLMPSITVGASPQPEADSEGGRIGSTGQVDGLGEVDHTGPAFRANQDAHSDRVHQPAHKARIRCRYRSICHRNPVCAITLGYCSPGSGPLDIGRHPGVGFRDRPAQRARQLRRPAPGRIDREIVGYEPLGSHTCRPGIVRGRRDLGPQVGLR